MNVSSALDCKYIPALASSLLGTPFPIRNFPSRAYTSSSCILICFLRKMSKNEPNNSFSIFESRIVTMVSSVSEEGAKSKPTLARFLKPSAKSINQAVRSPMMLSEAVSHREHPHPEIHFKGWKNPQTKWGDWVESLTGKHAFTWNQACICDALLSSLYEIQPNTPLILRLVEYWSPETNTFVFPWGEATITLEDVMILGGFSVLGEPVNLPLTDDMLAMESKLVELQRGTWKSKSKIVYQQNWIKLFMEELESHELEHVGFLSLWLSRFVFPSLPDSTIGRHVFSIAIHLSRGTRIALAPAVLATLYHNLSLLKKQLVSSRKEYVTVLGLFQLVQQWAFERFPILGPKCPNELKLGEPRAARWLKLNSFASDSLIVSALKSAENFKWHPYAADLKNWCFVSHYKENDQLVVDRSNSTEELRSFGVCLCADELVGLLCVERYMPYRVAKQFGMDQHLPGEFTVMKPSCRENFRFYVPSKYYKPSVSLEYLNWWQKSKLVEGKEILKPERKAQDSYVLCTVKTSNALDKIYMSDSDILMIAKQYCEEESHNRSSTASSENSSKRKISTKEESKEVESNSIAIGQDAESKRRAFLNDLVEDSYFSGCWIQQCDWTY
ncbi:Aminotransferase-like, plant mobile domain [Sesbania bispinosa]|nr:Aminotransferase-like, plant mobile domain [Sesbania bispinosa]